MQVSLYLMAMVNFANLKLPYFFPFKHQRAMQAILFSTY